MMQQFVSIHDDMYGEGTELAFPSMSTCSASIAVLSDRLVGVHKTMDLSNDFKGRRWNSTQTKILKAAADLIAQGGGARELYIAGWRVDAGGGTHDVEAIQAALGCSDVPTYIYNYMTSGTIGKSGNETAWTNFGGHGKKANDVCTFAFHRGTEAPRIALKRTTKVDIVVKNSGEQGGKALIETLETPSDHLHDLRKFQAFTRHRV